MFQERRSRIYPSSTSNSSESQQRLHHFSLCVEETVRVFARSWWIPFTNRLTDRPFHARINFFSPINVFSVNPFSKGMYIFPPLPFLSLFFFFRRESIKKHYTEWNIILTISLVEKKERSLKNSSRLINLSSRVSFFSFFFFFFLSFDRTPSIDWIKYR